MRSKADQRTKEDLDLFLLALIREGIATAYQMQRAAGISQGASLQALKRLVERKLVRVCEEGPRRRTEFQLTRAGEKWLVSNTAALGEAELGGDLDSVLRKGLLMSFLRKDGKRATELLRKAAAQRREREEEFGEPVPDIPEIAQLYTRYRKAAATASVAVEADVLEQAAAELARRSKRKG